MKIEHTTKQGRTVTLFIDEGDLPIYQGRHWVIREGAGLLEVHTSKKLARLILDAAPNTVVRFRDGNRFNVQRDNIFAKPTRRTYGHGPTKGRRLIQKSGDSMKGVFFKRSRTEGMVCKAEVFIAGRTLSRTFSADRRLGSDHNATMGRAEAYRRAVCWRIGTLLANGDLPDARSLEIFFEEHPRLCPYRRDYLITRESEVTYYASLYAGGKRLYRQCRSSVDETDAMRKAVFWCLGTLFAEELMPDEGSVRLLKRTIALCETAALPEEMYSGNADYQGIRVRGDGGEEEVLGDTGAVALWDRSFYG